MEDNGGERGALADSLPVRDQCPPVLPACVKLAIGGPAPLTLEQRLWRLRTHSMCGVHQTRLVVCIASAVSTILCLITLLIIVVRALQWDLRFIFFGHFAAGAPVDSISFLLLLAVMGAGLAGLYYCFAPLARSPGLFDRHYRLAWNQLLASEQPLLFLSEDYRDTVCERAGRFMYVTLWRAPQRWRLEQQLQFCACHLLSLRRLLRNPEARLPAGELQTAQLGFMLQGLFHIDPGAYVPLLVIGIALFGIPLVAAALLWTFAGPRYIISRAVLVAFIDFMLEDPRLGCKVQAPVAEE